MDLLSIDSLTDAQITHLLDAGSAWDGRLREGQPLQKPLDGRILCNLFFENSTRTMMSFAVAAHRLGGDVISLPMEKSSLKKGETLEDTARTLDAMGPDVVVLRHHQNGAAHAIADLIDAPVVNAGDGTNEHPTQALLDALTLRSHFGRIEGLKVAICGDIRHSRVARSDIKLLERLGAEVRLAGPPPLLPDGFAGSGAIDEAVEGADAIIMLRVQRERLEEDLGDMPGEYLRSHGLTEQRLATASPSAMVLHPGPINRGVEIADSVADDPDRSLILRQVALGVAMRMACLDMLAGNRA